MTIYSHIKVYLVIFRGIYTPYTSYKNFYMMLYGYIYPVMYTKKGNIRVYSDIFVYKYLKNHKNYNNK